MAFRRRNEAGRAIVGHLVAVPVVLALVLAPATGAFASERFRGKLKVSGDAATTSVVAIGDGGFNTWCGGYPSGSASASSGGSLTVTVRPAPARCGGSTLSKGRYSVNFVNGPAMSKDLGAVLGCMRVEGAVVNLGTIFVDRYGNGGPKTFSLPAPLVANGPSDESAVCVSDSTVHWGNQAPIVIL